MAPWIYLCFNRELSSDSGGKGNPGMSMLGESMMNKSGKVSSLNSSKIGGYQGLGTSTNVNKSGNAMIPGDGINNSQLEDELKLDEEFGYQTDEDSVFYSFE